LSIPMIAGFARLDEIIENGPEFNNFSDSV
jgi:hypothetical protein